MPDVVILGDTIRSPTLRHEVPLAIMDPFLYLERDGRRTVVTSVLEAERVRRVVPDAEVHELERFGLDELIAAGGTWHEVMLAVQARACVELGLREAAVPPDFPLALADALRAEGVTLHADEPLFTARRRVKSEAELAGIRRAQAAAEAGMAAAADLLAAAEIDGDTLRHAGETLTAEAVRARIREVCAAHGAPASDDLIVAAGAGRSGHDPGHGPLPAELPISIDLWPQDEASGCYADMTRTFVVGPPPEEVLAMHALCRDALERVAHAARPGLPGVELYGLACDVFEAAGDPTQRTKASGETLDHGFYFSLGHGVGLDVHELPALGRTGTEPLVAGDVVAVEPGTVRPVVGEVRVEDLLLITDDGCESLTTFPYDLTPRPA